MAAANKLSTLYPSSAAPLLGSTTAEPSAVGRAAKKTSGSAVSKVSTQSLQDDTVQRNLVPTVVHADHCTTEFV